MIVKYHPAVEGDISSLDNPGVAAEALRLIDLLSLGLLLAKQLGKKPENKGLEGCWARKFDDPTFGIQRFRLVFRYLPSNRDRQILEILAIGPRFEGDVYRAANQRLRELDDLT